MAALYSRSLLMSILESTPKALLNSRLWKNLCHLGISKSKPTRRGCRSGRGQRKAYKHSSSNPLDSNDRIASNDEIQGNQYQENHYVENLFNSSSESSNIQISSSAGRNARSIVSTTRLAGQPGTAHKWTSPVNHTYRLYKYNSRSIFTQNHQNLICIRRVQKRKPLKESLSLGCVNARSLRNKTEVFTDHVIDTEIDICVVTETWLRKRDAVVLSALTPPGYSFKNVSRTPERTGGGTGIMLWHKFKLTLVIT